MSVIDELVGELARLPGIGRKTALRLAFHLLKAPEEEARKLARAIQSVREKVRACTECGNLTEQSPCEICRSTRRDGTTLCVVEEASDIMAIERTGEYRGLYHVLHGHLAPLEGIYREDLKIDALIDRVRILCTVYDPKTGTYRVDYSLALEVAGGLTFALAVLAYLLNEWRGRRAARRPSRT